MFASPATSEDLHAMMAVIQSDEVYIVNYDSAHLHADPNCNLSGRVVSDTASIMTANKHGSTSQSGGASWCAVACSGQRPVGRAAGGAARLTAPAAACDRAEQPQTCLVMKQLEWLIHANHFTAKI